MLTCMVRNCFDSHELQPQPLLSKASLLGAGEIGEAREERAGAGSSLSVGSRRNREELCSNVLYLAIEKKKRLKGGTKKGAGAGNARYERREHLT